LRRKKNRKKNSKTILTSHFLVILLRRNLPSISRKLMIRACTTSYRHQHTRKCTLARLGANSSTNKFATPSTTSHPSPHPPTGRVSPSDDDAAEEARAWRFPLLRLLLWREVPRPPAVGEVAVEDDDDDDDASPASADGDGGGRNHKRASSDSPFGSSTDKLAHFSRASSRARCCLGPALLEDAACLHSSKWLFAACHASAKL